MSGLELLCEFSDQRLTSSALRKELWSGWLFEAARLGSLCRVIRMLRRGKGKRGLAPPTRFEARGVVQQCQAEYSNQEKYRRKTRDGPGDSARDRRRAIGADVIPGNAEGEIGDKDHEREANTCRGDADWIRDGLTPMAQRHSHTRHQRSGANRGGDLERSHGSMFVAPPWLPGLMYLDTDDGTQGYAQGND